MTEDIKGKIVQLMREGSTQGSARAPSHTISVTGNSNIVALGDIHFAASKPERPRIVVQTGNGVIDAKQKAALTRMLQQWLTARNVVRKDKMTIQAARKAMNDVAGVNSYHEMTPVQYGIAQKWIAKQRGILGSMKSAPVNIDGFRSQTITAIKARAKQLGDLHFYTPHIVQTYGFNSLTHLSDRQLQEVREWIFRQIR